MAELPSKLFFRIGEVAGLVGVEPHVLRYWEREFRTIRPTKSAKGQRVYSRRDVENLLRVRDLLYRDGFTIAGAKKRLQRGTADASEAESESETAEGVETSAREAPPPSPPTEPGDAPRTQAAALLEDDAADGTALRSKLVALRDEVEGFLDELTTDEGLRSRPPSGG